MSQLRIIDASGSERLLPGIADFVAGVRDGTITSDTLVFN